MFGNNSSNHICISDTKDLLVDGSEAVVTVLVFNKPMLMDVISFLTNIFRVVAISIRVPVKPSKESNDSEKKFSMA
jgi:hypothetical protein